MSYSQSLSAIASFDFEAVNAFVKEIMNSLG